MRGPAAKRRTASATARLVLVDHEIARIEPACAGRDARRRGGRPRSGRGSARRGRPAPGRAAASPARRGCWPSRCCARRRVAGAIVVEQQEQGRRRSARSRRAGPGRAAAGRPPRPRAGEMKSSARRWRADRRSGARRPASSARPARAEEGAVGREQPPVGVDQRGHHARRAEPVAALPAISAAPRAARSTASAGEKRQTR